MRILFASEYYPPFAPGGAEWTNAAWAAALARRGHSVVVVTPNYGAAPRETADGVTVVRVWSPVTAEPGQDEVGWRFRRNPLFTPYFAWQIARVARAERAELIHSQSRRALVPSWLAARRLGLPLVVTARDAAFVCPLGMCTLFEQWETFDCSFRQYSTKCLPFYVQNYETGAGPRRRARLTLGLRLAWLEHRIRHMALRRADAVVGVSRGILAILPSRVVPEGRRHVVHSLPPSAVIPTADDAARVRRELGIGAGPLVLYAGKLSLGKGTPVLLSALDRIRAAVPGVRFAFAGKGDMALPARDDVAALGVQPHATLFPLYRAADVVVVPSVWPEPLSRVIMEAMGFGRPVIATSVGGSPEAVDDGVTGLLVPRNDPVALADAIVALLRDPARRERMGAAARARVAVAFAEDRIVAALLSAYAAAERPA